FTDDLTTLNGDGSTSETVSRYNGGGNVLKSQTTTWTSADGYHAAITKSTPDGGYSENIDTQVNGSVVDATTYRKADGSTASQKTVTTS
ncbi:hypothetical protein ABTN09_20555, partial [Acinetobacter baumannii]